MRQDEQYPQDSGEKDSWENKAQNLEILMGDEKEELSSLASELRELLADETIDEETSEHETG